MEDILKEQERREYFRKYILPGVIVDVIDSAEGLDDIQNSVELEYIIWKNDCEYI